MEFILLIVMGGLSGWIASLITGTSGQGVLMDVILGVIGAILGGLVMNFFGQPGVTGFNLYSIIVAVIGAVLLVWIGRAITGSGGSVNQPR